MRRRPIPPNLLVKTNSPMVHIHLRNRVSIQLDEGVHRGIYM